MPHFVVTSGLDKRQRELISEMPHQEVVALVYPHLRARAESSQFPEECHKVLSVVCLELPARIRVFLHQDVLDRLNRVLDHLSFSSLISLICKKYDRQPFAAEVYSCAWKTATRDKVALEHGPRESPLVLKWLRKYRVDV